MAAYDQAVARGRTLMAAMNAPPEDPHYPSSTFKGFGELAESGWSQVFSGQFKMKDTFSPGMRQLMHGQNLALDSASNIEIQWDHDCEAQNAMGATMGAIIHKPTYGKYRQIFNTDSHTILAVEICSPQFQATQAAVPVPPLNHWSDVTYLQWAELCNNDAVLRRGIQRVVHCDMVNPDVQAVIDRVLGGTPIRTCPYPGRTIRASAGERFEALLGTSSLSGTAHMLAQHKHPDQLGWKVIDSINVWCPEPNNLQPDYFAVVNIVDKE